MKKIIAEKQTQYGLIQVEDRDDRRYLLVDGEMESCFLMRERKEALFPYMERFSYAFSINPQLHSCLMLGGGAGAYSSYYLRKYPQNTMDIVEISSDILQMARDYFYLEEVEKNPHLRIFNTDAESYLSETDQKYDLIINDAFIGREEAFRSADSIKMIHDHLTGEGIYMMNLVSAIRGLHARNLRKTEKALKACFEDTVCLPCSEIFGPYEEQNLVLAAMDREMI